MKKLLLMLTSAMAMVLIPAAAATAASTIASGQVTDNGKPVGGASVTATCYNKKGGPIASGSGITSSSKVGLGDYFIGLNPNKCKPGDKVVVSASKSSASGQNSAPDRKSGVKGLDVALVNVSIPEFGLAAGIVAASVVSGSFLIIRRKQHAQQGVVQL
ncbi:MAG TPA: hypothetical protein VGS28_05040 [Candidatus Saccharimonadales bacterium]|nr:hypothetical protein [Candidatus Saccharimonadales bacterium]